MKAHHEIHKTSKQTQQRVNKNSDGYLGMLWPKITIIPKIMIKVALFQSFIIF